MFISEIMPKEVFLSYILNKDTENYKFLKKLTIKQINKILSKYKNPFVAFSGGKDSTVMLHLVYNIKTDIWVRHWDYGKALIPQEIENQILSNIKYISPKAKLSYEKRPGGDNENARYSHVSKSGFFPCLDKAIRKHSWDLCFLGLRKVESSRRRLRLENYYIEPRKNHDIFFPMRNWTGKDIWTYICEYDLPVPSFYKVLSSISNDWNEARLATFFDKELESLGSFETSSFYLWRYKHLMKK